MSSSESRKVTSLKAYVNHIEQLRTDNPAYYSEQWFFRGQKDAIWDVRPNIFRNDNLEHEHIIIESAKNQNPLEFRDCGNTFEFLTKLQHYGLGTRLLDVTLNPFVALYFATELTTEYLENMNGQYSKRDNDGVVYYKFARPYSLQSLEVRISMAVPFLEFNRSITIEAFCDLLKERAIISNVENGLLKSEDYLRMTQILQSSIFIVAANSNARLTQQRGAFLLSPSINIETNSATKDSLITKATMDFSKEFDGCFIIPAKNKDNIRDELNFYNVNEATLFPELEHQLSYIQKQQKPNKGIVKEYQPYIRRITIYSTEVIQWSSSEIEDIIRKALPNIDEQIIIELSEVAIRTVGTVDWNLRESIVSHMHRSFRKILSTVMSTHEAQDKSYQISRKLEKRDWA